jgi:PIN domain nuclease of toxin-antitoxin system
MPGLLLDTCAIIFVAENQAIDQLARQEIIAASAVGGVLVSPVSAWEIGLLAAKRGFAFLPDPKAWFQSFMMSPGVRLTALTPEIAIDSCFLASSPPVRADPADRLLMATARALNVPIMTRDRRILGYAQAGLVGAIFC